jgi:hypothetical protein
VALFEGKLELRPWSKSVQSYCAQGSEYYVLIQKDGNEIVIKDDLEQNLVSFNGKEVQIHGKLETKTITPPQDPFAQHIVIPSPYDEDTKVSESSFTCTVLVVQQIQL